MTAPETTPETPVAAQSVVDRLNAATRGLSYVPVVLDAALQARYDDLVAQLEAAAAADTRDASLAVTRPHSGAILDEMDAVIEAMESSRVTFEVGQLHWVDRVNLQAAHPPRPASPVDALNGYNIETYIPALIRASCVAISDADGARQEAAEIPDATWEHLLGTPAVEANEDAGVEAEPAKPATLNFRAINDLTVAAQAKNEEPTRVPISARSWLETRASGTSSKSRASGESPRAAGKGGSRSGSPKSKGGPKAPSKDKPDAT